MTRDCGRINFIFENSLDIFVHQQNLTKNLNQPGVAEVSVQEKCLMKLARKAVVMAYTK